MYHPQLMGFHLRIPQAPKTFSAAWTAADGSGTPHGIKRGLNPVGFKISRVFSGKNCHEEMEFNMMIDSGSLYIFLDDYIVKSIELLREVAIGWKLIQVIHSSD